MRTPFRSVLYRCLILVLSLAWCAPAIGSVDTITTVAGGYPREDSPTTVTGLTAPEGVAVDGAGNVYFADSGNHRVRKLTVATGVITTVAGVGFAGAYGDGGPAGIAWLNSPTGVAVDSAGDIYIADRGNHRVRKVTIATGIITTVAGTGVAGFNGDDGPAIFARLNDPSDVVVGASGVLYIADRDNNRIRSVDAAGTITTIAGTGVNRPRALALDSAGDLYIADTNNHRIRKVEIASGTVTTVAGTGGGGFNGDGIDATTAQLNSPRGVAVNAAGDIYVGDRSNRRVRMVDAATGLISTVAGTGAQDFSGDGGPATAAELDNPHNVAVDGSGNLYLADTDNDRIRRVDTAGTISTVLGTTSPHVGDGGLAIFANIPGAAGVVADAAGNLFIADAVLHRVRRVDAVTRVITTVAGNGTQGFAGDGGPATDAELNTPVDVALDAAGNLYIADAGNDLIRRVDASGLMSTFAGGGGSLGDGGPATSGRLNNPSGIFMSATGILYIADTNQNRVRSVDTALTIQTVAGGGASALGDGGPATDAALNRPGDVTQDASGNLFIADTNNNRVRMVDTAGNISTYAGIGTAGFSGDGDLAVTAALSGPQGLAVDSSGNLIVSDTFNGRVRRIFVATGRITTVAGGGPFVLGFGDGEAAINAFLSIPQGLFADAAGDIFIADRGNGRVRKVVAGGNQAPTFSSLATAFDNPTLTGATVVFAAIATDPDGDVVSYVWDFGDGTTGYGAFTTHVYTVPGLYFAKVTASDGSGSNSTSGMTVVVNAAAPPDPTAFTVVKGNVKFNFAQPQKDILKLSGTIPVPADFTPDTKAVQVNVGDLDRAFTLDAKGKGVHATEPKLNQFKISGKTSPKKFIFAVKKQDLFAELDDLGFTNADILKPGETLDIPIAVMVDGSGYLATIQMVYLAKLDRNGRAKTLKKKK